jgi:cytoskeletal protein CcmA (bactofilin family)
MSFVKENPSIISKDLEIVGNLISKGSIEIEGSIKGDIEADTISIRENGKIVGNIKTKVLNVKGYFNGVITCEKINISDTAKIVGEINYVSLSADYGASINCQLKRIDKNSIKNDASKFVESIKVNNEKK